MTKNGIEVRDYGVVESDVASLASGEQQMFSSLPNVEFTEDGSNGLWSLMRLAWLLTGNKEGVDEEKKHNLIWVDPVTGCFALYSKLPSDQVLLQQSPLALAKALKVNMRIFFSIAGCKYNELQYY